MPVLARVAHADRLAVFHDVGDDQKFGVISQVELVQHMDHQAAKTAAEIDMLLRRDALVAKHQQVMVQMRLMHAGEIGRQRHRQRGRGQQVRGGLGTVLAQQRVGRPLVQALVHIQRAGGIAVALPHHEQGGALARRQGVGLQRRLADHHAIAQYVQALVVQADQDADLAGRGRAVVPPGLCGTAALGFRQRLPARIHRCQHRGIGQRHRRALGIGHHHGIAALGFAEQLLREGLRQAHAAVRSRVARQAAAMQGDAIPGQPLHVGHRRAVVEVGPVVLVLLQDGRWRCRCGTRRPAAHPG
ncbi:hypothetical protein G6F68_011938 [Rhizopus microsporus]|nr:hypothetical protein G6F68_011938 [Rhizopus microsporus]